MDLGLKGRAAAVAAASSGLGRAAARALAGEGCSVAVCARDPRRVHETAEAIARETGARTVAIAADVGVPEECRRFVENAAAAFGRLDVLVTNSGGPRPGAFEALSASDWEAGFRVTLGNVVHLVDAAIPHMKRGKWGRIVNITSISAKQPVDGLVLSNTFRPAVVGMAKTLATELAPYGILVNTVCPGYTRTDRLTELARARADATGTTPEEFLARLVQDVPLGRVGEPEEFGAVVAFLCSERASYLTGTTLAVDGGTVRGLL